METTERYTFMNRTTGKPEFAVVHFDGRCHNQPHVTPVYNEAGEFIGEVKAEGCVWKAFVGGTFDNPEYWSEVFHRAATFAAYCNS